MARILIFKGSNACEVLGRALHVSRKARAVRDVELWQVEVSGLHRNVNKGRRME